MKFQDWFDNRLVVGAFPFLKNENIDPFYYDYVINMSDEYHLEHITPFVAANCKLFWFPMNEKKRDIGLNSIYGALYILWLAEQSNKNVYLHCHSGKNRSHAVRAAYYYMRTGLQLETPTSDYGYINKLVAMSGRGYLPPKAEMEQFITLCGKKFAKGSLIGGTLDNIKLDSINNF